MEPKKRKDQIVAAAVRSFSKRGYHATQISDIIKSANVARGTFYLYFKSKHEIFHLILDDFINHLGDQIKTINIGADESPADQMRKNVERVVDVILDNPELAKIIFNEAVGLDHEIDKRLGEFYKRLIDSISASIKKGISLGLVRKIDPQIAACIIIGAFHEITVQNTIFKNTKIGRNAMVEGLIDALLGGLGGRPVL